MAAVTVSMHEMIAMVDGQLFPLAVFFDFSGRMMPKAPLPIPEGGFFLLSFQLLRQQLHGMPCLDT